MGCSEPRWDARQEGFGVFEAEEAEEAGTAGEPLDTERLVEPDGADDEAEDRQVGEETVEDEGTQNALPGRPAPLRLDGAAQGHLEWVHVHAGGADGGAGVADQAVLLVFHQVGRDREVAFGQGASHGDASAGSFRLVQREDVGGAGGEAQAAAHTGEHVVVLALQQGALRRGERGVSHD